MVCTSETLSHVNNRHTMWKNDTDIRDDVSFSAAFSTLCPFGHGVVPGPGEAREGER